VLDLAIPTEIVAHPTVREPDGLAMSSRNRYLAPGERRVAPALHRTLREAAERLGDGREAAPILDAATRSLTDAGFAAVDYLALRDAGDLGPLERVGEGPARLLAAARLGATRLIDKRGGAARPTRRVDVAAPGPFPAAVGRPRAAYPQSSGPGGSRTEPAS
jgi:pantoate--beta-alanine ligase